MKIGMIGMGKLGLPVSVAMSSRHQVLGYDIDPTLMCKRPYPHQEKGPHLKDDFQEHLDFADIVFAPLEQVVRESDIIFVSVQTPHHPLYEGVNPIPADRVDFDYTYLVSSIKTIAPMLRPEQVIVVISTVLPGTLRREIIPLLKGKAGLVYNPYFIAMGTVMNDFLNPEFILMGSDDQWALSKVCEFYRSYFSPEQFACMTIESAELTKVAYNTYISTKIAFANTLMEIADKIPNCKVDEVVGALVRANVRLISHRYMSGGMGDGGGCHPRDNIAMSWLAHKLDLSHDLFEDIMVARDDQAWWLVDLLMERSANYDLPIVILGKSFKPETNLTIGSPAILCANMLAGDRVPHSIWDPHVDGGEFAFGPSVFLIGTRHKCFQDIQFPVGSIVIDPHRYIGDQAGVAVERLGAR